MKRWHPRTGVCLAIVAVTTDLVCAARPGRVIQVSVCSTGCSHHWGATNYTVASFDETEVVYASDYGTTVSLQLGINGSVVSVNDDCVCVNDDCVQIRCSNPTRFFWIDYTIPCLLNSTDWLDRFRECVCEVSSTALPLCHSSTSTSTATTSTRLTATSTSITAGTDVGTTPRIAASSSSTSDTNAETGLVVAVSVLVLGGLFVAAVWTLRRSHDDEYPEESIYAEAGPPPPPVPTTDRPPLYDLGSNNDTSLPEYEVPQTYAVASKVGSTRGGDDSNPIYCSEESQLNNAPVIYDDASAKTGSSIENPLYDNTLEKGAADPYLWVGANEDAIYDNQP